MIWQRHDIEDWAPQTAACVMALPKELGRVTALNIRHGKVVASTESGIAMIVHKPRGL